MLSGIDGIRTTTAAFDVAAHRLAVASADVFGDEPSERTGPVGPFGTGEQPAEAAGAAPGVMEDGVVREPEPLPTPAPGLHGPDLLNEMLTLMLAHAQLPALLRGMQARDAAQRSLVDLRA